METLGITRAKEALALADLALAVFDATTPLEQEDRLVLDLVAGRDSLLLINKIDLPQRLLHRDQLTALAKGRPVLEISASLGWGRQELEQAVVDLVGAGISPAAPAVITRLRHQAALQRVRSALGDALGATNAGITLDCVAVDLWDAWTALGEILGEAVPEEVIASIFQDFCVGK